MELLTAALLSGILAGKYVFRTIGQRPPFKIWRLMRWTGFFMMAFSLHVSAGVLSQQVTLKVKNAPLSAVFKAIKRQTNYSFFFNQDLLGQSSKVTLELQNVSLEDALTACFKDQPFTYSIEGKIITLESKPVKLSEGLKVPRPVLDAPPITVKGRIVNENGEPVVASVIVKGTNKGTTSNANGEFELKNLNEEAVLIISATNIETISVNVDGKTDLLVNARTVASSLNEVVVNKGYYTETKKLSTGNVSTVNAKTIEKQPIVNPLQAMQGRMAGVDIVQNNGVPGGSFSIQIRGQNSLRNTVTDNGNFPLYIIDGVPFTSSSISNIYGVSGGVIGSGLGTNPLNTVNPSDIASIEVLKDADATSIYGSRGANGVVLITTKKGKTGKTLVDLNASFGVGDVPKFAKLLNTKQYLEMRREAFVNDNVSPGTADYDLNGTWDTTRYTDWQKELIGGTAQTNNIQGSISGGSQNTQFLVGVGYFTQGSVFPGDFLYTRTSAHFRLNHLSENKKFNLNFSANYSGDENNLPSTDPTSTALTLSPVAPASFDANGELNWALTTSGSASWANPMAQFFRQYKLKNNTLISNINLAYELFPGLKLKTSVGYTNLQLNEVEMSPQKIQSPTAGNRRGVNIGNSSMITWIAEPQIDYNKHIGSGKLSAQIGTSFQQSVSDGLATNASGFTSDVQLSNIGSATSFSNTVNYFKYKYIGVYGRINYNYQDKYIINVTGRRDGSSRFGPGKQFANFGAVGAAWIFSNEKFIFNESGILSFGKLRASYGSTGSDQIGNYMYLFTFRPNSFTYNGNPGIYPSRMANADYSWEVNKKGEIGIELGFLRDKIYLSVSAYKNKSSSQLVGYSLPNIAGLPTVQFNLPATIQNSGVEIELITKNMTVKNFSWITSLNITLPRNKLVDYPGIKNSSYVNTYEIGESLGIRKLYNYTGVNSQTGLYTVEDLDQNGSISSSLDRDFNKKVFKDFYGGFQNTFNYKQFSLDVFFQFVKQTGRNYLSYTTINPGRLANQPVEVLERWRKPGDAREVQKFSTDINAIIAYNNIRDYGSNTIVNSSFIRLKNVSFSYSIPDRILRKISFNKILLFVQGQNLWTITDYMGLDPETMSNVLPPLRMVNAGVQLTF